MFARTKYDFLLCVFLIPFTQLLVSTNMWEPLIVPLLISSYAGVATGENCLITELFDNLYKIFWYRGNYTIKRRIVG